MNCCQRLWNLILRSNGGISMSVACRWLTFTNNTPFSVETPKSLTCSSQTPDSILLHWMYPYANLSAYHIWYQHSAEDQEPTELMTSLPMGSHSVDVTIDGLESNSKYNVTVRAVVGTTESLDVKIQCTTLNSMSSALLLQLIN